MAINATFRADFSSFFQAVEKAEVELIDLSKGASRVETSLNRMVDNFSGRKLVQDAQLMSRAVEQIGGTSKLTASELESVGAKATAAVAKLKAMGMDIPPGLQKIAAETKNIGKETQDVTSRLTSMLGTVGKIAGTFGIAFGVGAIVNFGKSLLDSADEMVKLSDKTGLSIAALEEMQRVGSDTGVSLESMTGAISTLQRNIGNGSDGTVGALKALGLSFEAIRQMSPEEQFFAVSRALQGVEDQAKQVALGAELMGKGFTESLPAIKEGFDKLDPSLDKVNRTLDRTGNAIDRLLAGTKREAKSRLAIELENAIDTFTNLKNLVTGQFFLAPFNEALDQSATFSEKAGKANAYLGSVYKETADATKVLGINTTEQANKERMLAEDLARSTAARKKAAEELKQYRETMLGVKIVTADHVALVGELIKQGPQEVDVHKRVTEAVRDFVRAGQDIPEFMRAWLAAQTPVNVGISNLQHLLVGQFHKGLIDTGKDIGLMNAGFGETARELAGAEKKEYDFATRQTQVNNLLREGARELKHFGDLLKGGLMADLKKIPDMMAAAFTGGGGFKGAIEGIGSLVGSTIGQSVGKGISKAITGFGSLAGPIGGAIGSLLGPLIGKIANIGGPSKEELGARDTQKGIIDDFRKMGFAGNDFDVVMAGVSDAMRTLGRDADDTRKLVAKLLDTGHPTQYAAAVEELNAVLKEAGEHFGHVSDAAADLNAFTAEGVESIGKFNIATMSAVAIFDEIVRTTGDVGKALEAIGPTLDQLDFKGLIRGFEKELDKLADNGIFNGKEVDALNEKIAEAQARFESFGSAGGEAIESLMHLRDVSEANKGLMDNIAQTTKLFGSLQAAGILTTDMVTAFGQNAVNQFTLLKDATGDSTEALALMQPELQKLWEHQQKFGDITDDATLALLDQAEETGLVGEDMKDVNEQILDVMKQIRDVIAEATGNTRDFGRALNELPSPSVNLPSAPDAIPMAAGGRGRVTKPTLFLAGEAGPEDFAFSGGGKSFSGGGGTQIIQVVLPDGRILAEVVNDANDRTLRGRRKVRAA